MGHQVHAQTPTETAATFDEVRARVVHRRVRTSVRLVAGFYLVNILVGPLAAPPQVRGALILHLGEMFATALASALVLSRAHKPWQVEANFAVTATILMTISGIARTPPYTLSITAGASFVLLGVLGVATKLPLRSAAPMFAASWLALYVESKIAGSSIFIPLFAAAFGYVMLCFHARSRDRLEREGFEGRQRLAEANERLRASDEARSRLFINLSHDFRTPLAVIAGEAELLAARATEGEDAAALARVRRNAAALADLTDQLLELARLEAGRTPCIRAPFDLPALARDVALQLQPSRGNARVVVTGEPTLTVKADPTHVRRVLGNLVANGLRQVERRGGTVTLTLSRDGHEGGAGVVEVSDDGDGIAPERRLVIFERFASFDAAGSVASGIGLPLARELAALNGGLLVLLEGVARTTFRLRLPSTGEAATPFPLAPQDVAGHAAGGDPPEAKRERPALLVVEDHHEMAAVLTRVLAAKFTVRLATTMGEARAALAGALPRAVVCDVMLPDGDGYGLLECLRDRDDLVPFVFVSALGQPAERARGLRAGADDYLAKPFSGEELVARVVRAVERAEARERALAAQRQDFLAEVHDGVSASLTRAALALESSGARPALSHPPDPDATSDALAAVRDGLAEARAMMTLLEARHEDWSAVAADVRRETADVCGRAALTVRFDITSDDDRARLSPAEALTVRRVVREAITNVLKHAGAHAVECTLGLRHGQVHARVEDDGRGVTTSDRPGRGLGILARRVGRLGGITAFGLVPGGGGFVEARFPLAGSALPTSADDIATEHAGAAPSRRPAPLLSSREGEGAGG